MAVNLSPYGGVGAQFLDNAGNVLTGGKIFTYAAGTTTNQATYTTNLGNVPRTNPIILDASGRVPSGGEIWLTDGLLYKFVLTDSNDVLIATYDNIAGINSNFVAFTNQQEIQTATAGQTVFTLATMNYAPGTNSLSVFVDGVNQYGPGALYAYFETNSTTVTFTNGLHVGAEVKFTTSQLNSSVSSTNAFQVSYVPPFTGSTATNVGDKLTQTVSFKDFGAVGDGVTDDSVAWANFLAYLDSSGSQGFIPAGTYYIPTAPGIVPNPSTSTTPELDNYGNIVITGAGASVTTLLAKTEIIAPGTTATSRPILKIVNPTSFSLSDVTLDGGFSTVPTLNTTGYADKDAAALLEVRDCDKVILNNVIAKGFFGHRDNSDNDNGNFGRSGPILVANCSNGVVNNLSVQYPTWREGVFFFNAYNFNIDGFTYVGPTDRTNGSLSTPLNIFGPTTQYVNLTNSSFVGAWSGSVLNMGGTGGFTIDGFLAQGSISTTNDTTGDARTDAGTTTWGKGIDLGSEHQEDAFTSHPILTDVAVNNVVLKDMFSYSFRIIKTLAVPAKRVSISNILIYNGFEGIHLENVIDVQIKNAVANKILRYVSGSASNGFAYNFSKVDNLRFDGSCNGVETATYTYPNATTPGGGTVYSDKGFVIDSCKNLIVKATIQEFRGVHVLYDVVVADDNVYDGSFEINATAATYTSPTGYGAFYLFGRSATERLKTVQVFNSLFNNIPLQESRQAQIYTVNGSYGSQIVSVGNSKVTVALDELLGKVTFYNGDGSSSQQGVRAAIESYAADSNGRGAYLSFKTADVANPLTERLKINANGIKNMPLPTYASDAAAGAAGLVQFDLYQTSTGEVRIKL
jgi:hypothetical protein